MINPVVNIYLPFNLKKTQKKETGKLYIRKHTDQNGICHIKIASTSFPLIKSIKHFIIKIFTSYQYVSGEKALKEIYAQKWHLKPVPSTAEKSLTDPNSFIPRFEILDAQNRVSKFFNKLLRRDPLTHLRNEINKYNQKSETKINLKVTPCGRLFLKHTQSEMDTFIKECPILIPFFTNDFSKRCYGYKSCFGQKENVFLSSKSLVFYNTSSYEELYRKLKAQYIKMPIQGQSVSILPKFDEFSGSQQEINHVFKALLANSRGIFVGEVHRDKAPKKILTEQMQNLHQEGVRTLFLEHCCYDTLQPELDKFYRTKKASPFLKNFLSTGFGGGISHTNYYKLVEAAVKAGIRPVGIELSSTQLLGIEGFRKIHLKKRHLGMNVSAKEIIDREAGKDKYIALVGSGHVSYRIGNIAGLSELCGASSMIISDKKGDKPAYQTNQEFVGLTKQQFLNLRDQEMLEAKNIKMFNKSTKAHFTQVHMHL